jgi:tetratricopeptide (TPR) repeat protein
LHGARFGEAHFQVQNANGNAEGHDFEKLESVGQQLGNAGGGEADIDDIAEADVLQQQQQSSASADDVGFERLFAAQKFATIEVGLFDAFFTAHDANRMNSDLVRAGVEVELVLSDALDGFERLQPLHEAPVTLPGIGMVLRVGEEDSLVAQFFGREGSIHRAKGYPGRGRTYPYFLCQCLDANHKVSNRRVPSSVQVKPFSIVCAVEGQATGELIGWRYFSDVVVEASAFQSSFWAGASLACFGMDFCCPVCHAATMAEKSVNDLPRDLRLLFTKGNDALQRENYDYAIDLFNQVLAKEPTLYDCRKALRMAQLRKAGAGRGFFGRMLSNAGSSPMIAKGQLALRRDPVEALHIAEQVLNSDPNSSAAHRLVVGAATALEMPRTAVLSLEIMSRNAPKDPGVAIELANALASTGDVMRAEKLLDELHREFPLNNDLFMALKNISARKTMDKGGYEALADGQGSYRDILKNEGEAVELEQANRQVKTEDTAQRLIEEYELRLKSDPKNMKLLRDLAELYTQKKEFDRALSFYERMKAAESGGDASLDKGIAETMVRKFEHEISQLDPDAPDYSERLARTKAEQQAYQLLECQKRAERFPTDLQIRFELGQLYFQAGKIGEAIKEFQRAQANPHRRIAAMNYLAQCFARRGITDLAASTFQEAIKEKIVFDDEKKDLIYQYGSLLEKMDKPEEAIAQFKLIYAVDASYRDVDEKMNQHYSR